MSRLTLWDDGLVTVDPMTSFINSEGTWRISLTTKHRSIQTGGAVQLIVPPFWGWSSPQSLEPQSPGYTTAHCSDSTVALSVTTPARFRVRCTIDKGTLDPGETLTFIYGDTIDGSHETAKARGDTFAEESQVFQLLIDAEGTGTFAAAPATPLLTIRSAAPTHLTAYAPTLTTAGREFHLRIAAVDGGENRSEPLPPRFVIIGFGNERHQEIAEKERLQGFCSIPIRLDKSGWYRATIRDESGRSLCEVNPVHCRNDEPLEQLYWGDLHGHSALSDGTGTPDAYFSYAEDVAGLDFCALTDHDDHGFLPLPGNSWRTIRDAVQRHYKPGRFVTFLGYEWTSWTFGHRNVYFPGNDGDVFSFSDPASDTLPELWAAIAPFKAMTVPHHVAGGPVGADWRYHDPTREWLVEIVSVHGSSESPQSPSFIYSPKKGSTVVDALNLGYHLGIIASSDCHDGHPGAAPRLGEMRGIVAVRAEKLDRESLWDSLRERHCYGTSGEKIYLEFSLNGSRMGSRTVIPSNFPRTCRALTVGTQFVEHLSLFKNGRIVHHVSGKEYTAELTWIDETGSSDDEDYYFVRVLQLDGQMAWSSPIWVSRRP